MAKPLMDIYEGIVKTTVGGALWFLFCLFGVRQLLWTEPGALYMLGKHSATKPYMQISDDIFGQMTKRATNSKGQVNSVCSLVWCREKEKNNNYPLGIIPNQTK